jgi:hypothetical protein
MRCSSLKVTLRAILRRRAISGRFSNRRLEAKHFQTIRHRVMASLRPRWIYRQRPC